MNRRYRYHRLSWICFGLALATAPAGPNAHAMTAQLEAPALSLSLEVPLATVNALMRTYLPDVVDFGPTKLEGGAVKLLMAFAEPSSLGMLSDGELSLALSNLSRAELRNVGGQFHLAGTVSARATVTASKKHIQTETCHKRVGRLDVPYPCVKTSESREKIADFSLEASFDLAASVRSNAPSELSRLALSVSGTCGTINIRGLPNEVERLVHPFVCRALASKLVFDVKLESLVQRAAKFGGLRIERFDARPDGELFVIDIAFSPPPGL